MFYAEKGGWRSIREAYLAFTFAASESPDLVDDENNSRTESAKQRKERKLREERLIDMMVLKAFRYP